MGHNNQVTRCNSLVTISNEKHQLIKSKQQKHIGQTKTMNAISCCVTNQCLVKYITGKQATQRFFDNIINF